MVIVVGARGNELKNAEGRTKRAGTLRPHTKQLVRTGTHNAVPKVQNRNVRSVRSDHGQDARLVEASPIATPHKVRAANHAAAHVKPPARHRVPVHDVT